MTGGAGYIGSILIPILLENGHKVTLLDIFKWGVKPILHFASHRNLDIIKGDIRDKDIMKKIVPDHSVIMHLAAIVGYPACADHPNLAYSVNVSGSNNVVKFSNNNQKLIFASTGSTYGKVDGICTEETPISPLSLYGETKWKAEKLFLKIGGVALRFATVFGNSPRLRLDLLVNDFVFQALHSHQIVLYEGHFRRTFLHSLDAARSYLFALNNYSEMSGRAYNVGNNDYNYTKKEVALKIQEHVDYYLHEADIEHDYDIDARDYEVSYDLIKNLGYKTDVDMDSGINELIKILTHITILNEWRNS